MSYDDMMAKDVFKHLRTMTWKKDTREMLGKLDEYLLHSSFEEAEARKAREG